MRAIAAPFLRSVAERVPDLVQKLRVRSQELTAAGYHAQVLVEEDASLLFLLQGNRRIPLRAKSTRFVARDRDYDVAELQELGIRLSPNALLRPVMQDYLLPTVTYVAGPSEIAYFAQSNVLYRELLGRMPVIYPRNSMTILDARASKLLDRYGLNIPDLLDTAEKVKSRIAARLVPQDLKARFSGLKTQFATSLQGIQCDLAEFDPTLESASAKSTAKILYQLDKITQKAARETLRRDARANSDAQYLINLIYPHRRPQERLYSIVPFLAKFGMDLPKHMLSEIQLSCPDHMVRAF